MGGRPDSSSRAARRCPSSRSRWGWWPPAGARPRGRPAGPGPRPGGRGVHRGLERPRPPGRAGALRPRRRGARAPGGGAGRRVGHPRPAGGARLPGRAPPTATHYDAGGLVWVTGHPADRGVGGGALRAAPPLRGGPVPRRRGHGGLAVPGVRRPLPAHAGRQPGRGRRGGGGARRPDRGAQPRPVARVRAAAAGRGGRGRRPGGGDPPRRAARGRAERSRSAGHRAAAPPNRPARPGPWRWVASPSWPPSPWRCAGGAGPEGACGRVRRGGDAPARVPLPRSAHPPGDTGAGSYPGPQIMRW